MCQWKFEIRHKRAISNANNNFRRLLYTCTSNQSESAKSASCKKKNVRFSSAYWHRYNFHLKLKLPKENTCTWRVHYVFMTFSWRLHDVDVHILMMKLLKDGRWTVGWWTMGSGGGDWLFNNRIIVLLNLLSIQYLQDTSSSVFSFSVLLSTSSYSYTNTLRIHYEYTTNTLRIHYEYTTEARGGEKKEVYVYCKKAKKWKYLSLYCRQAGKQANKQVNVWYRFIHSLIDSFICLLITI